MDTGGAAKKIRLLLSDVDGVMTDGGIVLDASGGEAKRFHVRDGLGIKLWQRAGRHFGIVTGRSSEVVAARAAELGISVVHQGVADKWSVAESLIDELGLRVDQTGFIGDDLPDLPVMQQVGLGFAVADADQVVRQAADYVCTSPGGGGAVREVIGWLLVEQGLWESQVAPYRQAGGGDR